MEYQYLITEEQANTLADKFSAELQENTGRSDFGAFAINIIKQRINSKLENYREYGMYWPALKKVLNNHNANLGNDLIDDPITRIYGNYEREEAIIAAAEDFREFYKDNFFAGTNSFTIDEQGNNWKLYDSNLEA